MTSSYRPWSKLNRMFMGVQRIDLVLEGGAISERHRRDLAANDLHTKLSNVVVARLAPDQSEVLRVNAAPRIRSD